MENVIQLSTDDIKYKKATARVHNLMRELVEQFGFEQTDNIYNEVMEKLEIYKENNNNAS